MKCDELSVKLDLIRIPSGKRNIYDFDISFYVNGIKFEGYVEYWCLFSDTHLLDPNRYKKENYDYSGDYEQYNRALKKYDGIYSDVYLESCSCGAAGCAGIYNGLRVYKKKKYFKYVAKKRDGYSNGILNTGKWNLTFTKENMYSVRKSIVDFFIQNENLLKNICLNEINIAKKYKKSMSMS